LASGSREPAPISTDASDHRWAGRWSRSRWGLTLLALLALVAAGVGYLVQLLVTGGPDRVRDGSLVVAVPSLPTNLNPAVPGADTPITQMVTDQIWPQPFTVGPDGTLEPDGSLLSSAEVVSLKPQTVLYQINPHAVWSDGVPITESDFLEAWRQQRHEMGSPAEDPTLAQGYADIARIKSSQRGRQVTVVFKRRFADWEALFANLLPAHVVRQRGWAAGFVLGRGPAVSGGPFEVGSYQPGRRLVLRRNPLYWGEPAGLASITFEQLDPAKDAQALASRAVQMVVPPADPAIVQAIERVPGLGIGLWPSFSFEQLEMNQTSPWLADQAVRRAVAEVLDRTQLKSATVGLYDPGLPLDGSHIFIPSQSQYQDDATMYEPASSGGSYQGGLDAVEAFFASAGFSLGPDGYLHQGGDVLSLRLLAESSPLQQDLATLVSEQLRAAGVQVELEVMNGPAFRRALAARDFDLALVVSQASAFPSYTRALYGTPGLDAGGSQNDTGYSNSQVDSLFSQAVGQLDATKAAALYNQIDQILWTDLDTVPLFPLPGFVAYRPRYAGVDGSPGPSGPFWDAATWVELPASRVAHSSG
jgi:peptide/nickel transport system substrate-binding protein